MKHAGILAHSPDGSALCYLELIHLGHARFGGYGHGDVTMDYIPFGSSRGAWDRGDLASVRATLAKSIGRLKAAGADFFLCPDNTAHIALEREGAPLALPGLNIADVLADEAVAKGYRRIGILGTRFTMAGPIYPRALGARGLGWLVPETGERETIDRIIFDELCAGVFTDASRKAYLDIIARLKTEGCDAVALACTEIPLLVTPDVSPLPTLDSTRLLAKAAFDVTTGERQMPVWRGGPI